MCHDHFLPPSLTLKCTLTIQYRSLSLSSAHPHTQSSLLLSPQKDHHTHSNLTPTYTLSLWVSSSVTRWLDYFLYLAIQNNINLPNGLKLLPKQVLNFPNTKQTLKKLPKTFKISPKQRNFAKSGHTGTVRLYT